jgi:hypothetical protein
MKYTDDLYIDSLYNYVDREGNNVERYLITFYGEENHRYDIEINVINKEYIQIEEGESDPIDGEDRLCLFYLLDRWAINHLI